jgi:hypothetical protein
MPGVGNTFDNSSARSGRGGSSRFSPALGAGGGGAGFTNKRGKGRVINLSIYLLDNAHKAQVEVLGKGKGLGFF